MILIMKLYIQNLDINLFKDIHFEKSYKKNYIYTKEGILIEKKEKYFKLTMKEEKYYNLEYKSYDFLIDNSIYCEDLYSYIPYDNICVEEYYHINIIDYNLNLVKHNYLNQVSYYFESNNKFIDDELLDKICSFLSKK